MTPGQEAQHEAMRIEQAKIYGQLQPEHQVEPDTDLHLDDLTSGIVYWRNRGQSHASVAFRLGVTKTYVVETLRRLGAA